MGGLILPFVYVTLLWFFSTGAILWLNRCPRETHPGSITAATPLAGAAVCMLIVSSGETSVSAAYLAFTAALIIWGWHEMSFLMGFVTGPNRQPLPADARGLRRFILSTRAVIHHELALAATLLAVIALSWGQPNQAGALTFGLLFVMRLSAKLNIFLGVANLSDEMMPAHMAYLKSHFRVARMNPLFPLSIVGGVGLAIWLYTAAVWGGGVQYALLFALTVLAVIEHFFMMLPVRDSALWRWAMPVATNGSRGG
jgi:putative photosynthetic complex assembly protein 2